MSISVVHVDDEPSHHTMLVRELRLLDSVSLRFVDNKKEFDEVRWDECDRAILDWVYFHDVPMAEKGAEIAEGGTDVLFWSAAEIPPADVPVNCFFQHGRNVLAVERIREWVMDPESGSVARGAKVPCGPELDHVLQCLSILRNIGMLWARYGSLREALEQLPVADGDRWNFGRDLLHYLTSAHRDGSNRQLLREELARKFGKYGESFVRNVDEFLRTGTAAEWTALVGPMRDRWSADALDKS